MEGTFPRMDEKYLVAIFIFSTNRTGRTADYLNTFSAFNILLTNWRKMYQIKKRDTLPISSADVISTVLWKTQEEHTLTFFFMYIIQTLSFIIAHNYFYWTYYEKLTRYTLLIVLAIFGSLFWIYAPFLERLQKYRMIRFWRQIFWHF